MSVATSPIITKQQSKLPTSMRYERVQDILENEPAFRNRLSPKNHSVETRFGEKLLVSKETVDITEALHGEGKDAHKVPKNDVLRMAARMMKVGSNNGTTIVSASLPVITQAKSTTSTAPPSKKKKPPTPPVKPQAKTRVKPDTKPKPIVKKKPEPKPEAVKIEPKKSEPPPEPEPKRVVKPPVVLEEQTPESELPPEKQPLHLPKDFDPSKFPHYSVQNSIYCLLLSALSLAEHYEKYPGAEERQKKIEDALKEYLDTCNLLKLKTT